MARGLRCDPTHSGREGRGSADQRPLPRRFNAFNVFQEFPRVSQAIQRLPRISKALRGLPRATKGCHSLPRAFEAFQALPRRSEAVQGLQGLPRQAAGRGSRGALRKWRWGEADAGQRKHRKTKKGTRAQAEALMLPGRRLRCLCAVARNRPAPLLGHPRGAWPRPCTPCGWATSEALLRKGGCQLCSPNALAHRRPSPWPPGAHLAARGCCRHCLRGGRRCFLEAPESDRYRSTACF